MISSPLRWHGGKKNLRAQHIAMFPKGYTRFVDACCGAMWVLFGLPRHDGVAEYANDLNGDLMNFWYVLKGKQGDKLIKRLQLTPLGDKMFSASRFRNLAADEAKEVVWMNY